MQFWRLSGGGRADSPGYMGLAATGAVNCRTIPQNTLSAAWISCNVVNCLHKQSKGLVMAGKCNVPLFHCDLVVERTTAPEENGGPANRRGICAYIKIHYNLGHLGNLWRASGNLTSELIFTGTGSAKIPEPDCSWCACVCADKGRGMAFRGSSYAVRTPERGRKTSSAEIPSGNSDGVNIL